MNLHHEDGRLFYKLCSALMFYANQHLHILDEPGADAEAHAALSPFSRAILFCDWHEKDSGRAGSCMYRLKPKPA